MKAFRSRGIARNIVSRGREQDEAGSVPATALKPSRKQSERRVFALLFIVMLATSAGNTALQSVLPAIGRSLKIPD